MVEAGGAGTGLDAGGAGATSLDGPAGADGPGLTGMTDETAGGAGAYEPGGGTGSELVLMGAHSLTVLVMVTVTAGAQAAMRISWCCTKRREGGVTLVLCGHDSAGERGNREELEAEHVDELN